MTSCLLSCTPTPFQKGFYSKTCVRQPLLKLTLVVDMERWLSYKGTCHVILLVKLHDMCLYETDNFFHINHYLKSVSNVALLHRFYCTLKRSKLFSFRDTPIQKGAKPNLTELYTLQVYNSP